MLSIIVENQYFAPVEEYKRISQNPNIKYNLYDLFRKGGFRNRCVVSGSNGLIYLTVPVAGGRNQKLPMKDVQISYSENWQRSHIRCLATSYSKSPFYHFYKNDIDSLILSNTKFLVDLNYQIFETVFKILKMSVTVEPALDNAVSDYGFGSRSKYDADGIPLDTAEELYPYAQVFEDRFGFQPNLSILDLLFCEGPNASNILDNR